MAVQMVMNAIDRLNKERLRASASQKVMLWAIYQRKAGEVLDVLDLATLPGSPSKPNHLFIALLGLGVGLTLGIFRLERSRPRAVELATA